MIPTDGANVKRIPSVKWVCIQAIFVFFISILPGLISGQSLYLQHNTRQQVLMDRVEILLQKNADLNIYKNGSLPRPMAVQIAGLEDSSSGKPSIPLSSVDRQNLKSLLRNNAEYVNWNLNRKDLLYRNRANFVEVNKDNFFFSLNPAGLVEQSFESDNSQPVYHFAGGAVMRVLIAKKLGFYSYVTKHAESAPLFLRHKIAEYNAFPGAGNFMPYKKGRGFVYYDARGGVNFNASKHFNIEVAFDRNFIGNGYRSLFLSDYGYNYLYLKANTYIWKFRYQHLYAKLANPFSTGKSRESWPYGEKVMFMHHLNINATKWLNLGIFQALIANEKTKWKYINPVMFFPRSQSQRNQPPDNDLAGLDFKANVAKRAQFYGQLLMDNFSINQATKGKDWWNNRFGVQLGMKYINLFKVKNLDLQVEFNAVRPFTYSTTDSIGNYSHYNQPLAHPLGANFREWITSLRYQPHRRITILARAIIWTQGLDTAKFENYGYNIFKGNSTRPRQFGYEIPSGYRSSALNTQFMFSYELGENILLEAALLIRKISVENNVISKQNTTLLSAGLRMNLFKREYDF